MSKRNIIICIVLLAFIATGAVAQSKKIIKKETDRSYVPAGKDSLVPDQTVTVKQFDRKGNLIEQNITTVFENQMLHQQTKNYYNEKGLLDSALIYSNDKFSEKLGYKYNDKGQKIEVQEYTIERKPTFLSKHYYDSLGNDKRVEMYKEDKSLYNFKDFVYEKNNLMEESGSQEGERKYHWKYIYDAKNLLKTRKDLSGKEELLRVHNYQYNKDQRLVRENVYDAKGVLIKVIKYFYEFYN